LEKIGTLSIIRYMDILDFLTCLEVHPIEGPVRL
jgi:hypothetical protein